MKLSSAVSGIVIEYSNSLLLVQSKHGSDGVGEIVIVGTFEARRSKLIEGSEDLVSGSLESSNESEDSSNDNPDVHGDHTNEPVDEVLDL